MAAPSSERGNTDKVNHAMRGSKQRVGKDRMTGHRKRPDQLGRAEAELCRRTAIEDNKTHDKGAKEEVKPRRALLACNPRTQNNYARHHKSMRSITAMGQKKGHAAAMRTRGISEQRMNTSTDLPLRTDSSGGATSGAG